MIHSTAVVSPKAQLGKNIEIGAYSIIHDDVIIGDNCYIANNVTIDNGARIGDDCKFYTGSVISSPPQDLKYANEPTNVFIGNRVTVREYATVNRGTTATRKTTIGDDVLIMTYCHVAHDCIIGDKVVISNLTQLAGHVEIGDWAILGGFAKITQFCIIGKHTMIGADVKIVKDVPHYALVGRLPAQIEGINKIGLKRRGFEKETIDEIEKFYNILLFSGHNTTDGINTYLKFTKNVLPEVQECIDLIKNSTRGILR